MTPNWTSPLRYAGPTNKAGMAKVASEQRPSTCDDLMNGGLFAYMQIWKRPEKDKVGELFCSLWVWAWGKPADLE